jgi:AcrR family transcriptional regulator
MARRKQVPEEMRKKPKQKRSVTTFELVLEASARIIEQEGMAALTTNRIAERAGISIGTLYEYFPNKDAILIAMARRRIAEDERQVREAFLAAGPDVRELARAAIRKMIALHLDRPKVRRAVMAVHLAHGHSQEHARPVQDIAELVIERLRANGRQEHVLTPGAMFVLTRAVIGVVRAAFEERSGLAGTRDLEDALVALVEGFLASQRVM